MKDIFRYRALGDTEHPYIGSGCIGEPISHLKSLVPFSYSSTRIGLFWVVVILTKLLVAPLKPLSHRDRPTQLVKTTKLSQRVVNCHLILLSMNRKHSLEICSRYIIIDFI